MSVKKRVFTKVLGKQTVLITGEVTEELGLDAWLAQEDVHIIGYQLTAHLGSASENDGLAGGMIDLTQAPGMAQDGSLGMVSFHEYWNTAPPFGAITSPTVSVVFAQGKEVSLKEGEYLSLLARVKGKSAGTSNWDIFCTVYYEK